MGTCPNCAAKTTDGVRRVPHRASTREFILVVPAVSCRRCEARYLDAEALEWAELQVACRLAMEGPADGATLRAMRKVLGIFAAQLASMFGMTAETLSRWETGQRRVDRSAWIVVGSMVLEKAELPTATLARLKAAAGPVPAKVVTIDARPSARTRTKRISGVVVRSGAAKT